MELRKLGTRDPLFDDTLYDPKCEELAEAFLEDVTLSAPDRARHTRRLAQEIQRAVETFFDGDRDFQDALFMARGGK